MSVQYTVVDSQQCDCGMRYVVMISHMVALWLRLNFVKNDDYFWLESGGNGPSVDIAEEVLTMMALKWAQ